MAYAGVVKVGIGKRLEDGAEGGIWKRVQESKGLVKNLSRLLCGNPIKKKEFRQNHA